MILGLPRRTRHHLGGGSVLLQRDTMPAVHLHRLEWLTQPVKPSTDREEMSEASNLGQLASQDLSAPDAMLRGALPQTLPKPPSFRPGKYTI